MQALKKFISFSSAGLLVGLLLGLHSVAISPQNIRAMDGMHQGANSSVSCITICTFVALQKDDYLSKSQKHSDDDPDMPFYVRVQTSQIDSLKNIHSQQTRLAIDREPPPRGPPAYITLSVFRA